MADIGEDSVSEDQWLYGDSNSDQPQPNGDSGIDNHAKGVDLNNPNASGEPQPPGVLEDPTQDPSSQNGDGEDHLQPPEEEGEEGNLQIDEGHPPSGVENGNAAPGEGGEFEEDDDSEDDDDAVNVVIGDIRTSPQYSTLNIKRGGLLTSAGGPPQLSKQPGKFSIEEFEQIGTINGVPAVDYNLDSLEDKPWRKPGADITDYFNYGFNEDTWRAYCERQKRMRIHESGVGLVQTPMPILGPGRVTQPPPPMHQIPPPPVRRSTGAIDVIGGQTLPTRRADESPPQENVIQVMTADRRDYSRKGFPDMMVPPPGGTTVPPPGFTPGLPPPHIAGPPPGFPGQPYDGEFYPEMDPYYAYEPTQDSQWTEGQVLDKVIKQEPVDGDPPKEEERRERDRDRDRERERDRDRDRHRDRDRDRHRHRSRSRSTERRSRKHKSRSRSPGHRSHKKKKSKKSERQKEESD